MVEDPLTFGSGKVVDAFLLGDLKSKGNVLTAQPKLFFSDVRSYKTCSNRSFVFFNRFS